MRLAQLAGLLALLVAIAPAARGDIVVFKDGTYEEGRVKSESDGMITLEGPYGDVPCPANLVYSVLRSSAERAGLEYYQAGLAMLRLNNKHKARVLFTEAARYDSRYGEAGTRAIRQHAPQRPTDTASRLRAPSSEDARSRMPLYKVKCELCAGSGKVEHVLVAVANPSEYGFATGVG